jgi:DNA-binding NarL/FixJ family response regulator
MPITLSLVEDHPGVRKSLAALLNNVPGFRCLEPFGTGEEAVKKIPAQRPDVALVDINLPGMSGIECVAKLKGALPELEILMLTMYEQTDLIFNSLRAGASGYLLKSAPAAELIQAIEQVHAGGAPMSMQIARKVVQHFEETKSQRRAVEKLTKQEQDILELLVQGCMNKEVADRLNLSLGTVRAHLHVIYGKLRVQSRTQAVVRFLGREVAEPRRKTQKTEVRESRAR